MKRIATIFLTFILVLTMFGSVAQAVVSYEGSINEDLPIVLIDAKSGEILHEQNADEKIKPASTTKILTCLVAIENANLADTVTVSSHAADTSGSRLKIKNGEEFVLEDLLIGMMMVSGNDAAVAVAEHVGKTEENFVEMMNSLAKEIGMTSSHFANPHGKDNDEHYVTAHDMALLGQYASNNATLMQLIDRESFTLPETKKQKERIIENYDYLVRSDSEFYYQYATGIKTGSTTGAGDCLVASATKEDQNLVCVVFGVSDRNKSERWDTVKNLFDFGFDNFTTIDVLSLIDTSENISGQVENFANSDIYDGLLEFQQPMPQNRYITLENDIAKQILDGTDTIEVTKSYFEDPLTAPIYKDDVVGTITYTYKSTNADVLLFTGNLVASRDVLEAGSSSDSIGDTAVMTMSPEAVDSITKEKDNSALFFLLIIPAGLVAFLLIRIFSVKRKKRRKYRRKKPQYSYKIRK